MHDQILGLITPMVAATFVVVFLILWSRANLGDYVLGFSAAYLLFALGFSVDLLVSHDTWYVCLLAQAFYAAGGASLVWAAARRLGQRISLGWLATIYAVSAAMLVVAMACGATDDQRLHIVNVGYAVMFIVGALTMMQAPRRTVFDRMIILLFVVSAAQLLMQPVMIVLFNNGGEAAEAWHEIYDSALSVAVTAHALIIAVTLVGACVYDQIEAVRRVADTDGLTGLRTRRAFEHETVHLLERAKQDLVPVSLVVADIDHFKAVNDVWGHQVGDRAIAQFAKVIANSIRTTDVAGRIGGEEFCILAWNCDQDAALAMAERIRRTFAETLIDSLPEDHRLTASFGVAGRTSVEGYGKLFARCDSALYEAKERGRNRCAQSTSEQSRTVVTPISQALRSRQEALG